jgi:RNA polymerase sigma factor (sigma-70 family)
VTENDALAGQFEAHRDHLRAVAYRMLGSSTEADDAVQEAWLRLSRSGPEGVQNLGGWLTTVVARVCLDMLRSPAGPDASMSPCMRGPGYPLGESSPWARRCATARPQGMLSRRTSTRQKTIGVGRAAPTPRHATATAAQARASG